jgi:AbrB family looped-hinge helix DNA binding protein
MTNSWIVKVQKDGRITLPKDLMEQMGWRVGDTLSFSYYKGVILVARVVRTEK